MQGNCHLAGNTMMALVIGTAVAATLWLTLAAGAQAQRAKFNIIRDAEIEALMQDYARPIFRAAKIASPNIEIILLGDKRFNAFVVSGHLMFVNMGVLLQSKTPNELIGVLAHETGHIAGGHLARMREAISRAQIIAAAGALLGAGAAAVGAASNVGNAGMGGAAVIMGAGNQVAQRSLLAYMRSEELSADRAAVTYLERTGQSSKGMLTTFKFLASQQMFASKYADPYAQSHPMARARVSQLDRLARKSRFYKRTDDPALQRRHDLARAKLIGFISHPRTVARTYPRSDKSLPAQYARAVSLYRHGKPSRAFRAIDGLIKQQKRNPFFWELKGQALVELGRPKQGVAPLRTAVKLAPNSGLIRIMLGHAMVSSNVKSYLPEAIGHLKRGLASNPSSDLGWRQLSTAYARTGRIPQADLATARGMLGSGNIKNAKRYAKRAQGKLKYGTPAWLQADDILTYKPPRLK